MAATQLSRCAIGAIFTACLGIVSASSAMADGTSAVEKLIAANNPCAELNITQLGLTVGIDRLQRVSVDGLDMSLRGNDFSLSLAGTLACATPDNGLVKGNASASVNASAALDLSDCRVISLDVDLNNFGGTLALVVDKLQALIESQLEEKLYSTVVKECGQLMSGR